MIDLFFFCSHQFLMISWFDFSIMMPYYLWTLFPWPFENVHFILNIQLIKVFYGWQSVNGIVIQSSITLLHTRHTGPGSRTADRVITATLTQHNRFRFTFFADTRGPPRQHAVKIYLRTHTSTSRRAQGACLAHACCWPPGRWEGVKEELDTARVCLLLASSSTTYLLVLCTNFLLKYLTLIGGYVVLGQWQAGIVLEPSWECLKCCVF